ncbi:MAG TPA: TetR/AcrR family transcriptional regulator [Planctomycetota bacterium]|nr:TetR/AcrR family transcriptional regulator [Planctomycetota bacterium]
MGRPNQSEQRRDQLIPTIAATFAELGYRRTTTALLAERCGAQETILYRLWPDKRAMFTASIDYVVEHSQAIWAGTATRSSAKTQAEAVLDYEADHLGEFGLYRILFAGLSETDDPAIAKALRAAYRSFHRFLLAKVDDHRQRRAARSLPDAEWTAWALLGLGTVVNLGRELDLLPKKARARLLSTVGRQLLG